MDRAPRGRLAGVGAIAVALVAATLAGCLAPTDDDHHDGDPHGGDAHHGSDGEEGEGNLALTGAEDVVVNVTAGTPSEFRFTPDRIEVGAGERVGIVFENVGGLPHEFSIEDIEFHLHAASGETEQGAFIAPEPGEYVIGCYIPGHFESGMKGTLVVT